MGSSHYWILDAVVRSLHLHNPVRNWFYVEPDTIYTGKLLELNEEGTDFLQSGLISHYQNKNFSYCVIILYHIEHKMSSYFHTFLE